MRERKQMTNSAEKKQRAQLEKTIDELTLFDDDLMSRVFDENIAATTLLLRIILQRKDIRVTYVKGQEELRNFLQEGRTIRLDIKAEFDDGTHIDVEVQRSAEGSHVRRSRFHSSVLDARMLVKNEKFRNMRDSYVIFICEHDKFQMNLPMYHVERYVVETGEPVNDGSHIIYVNGMYQGDDEVGQLMRDFSCRESKDIRYKELADGVRHFKETEKGRDAMCDAFEKLAGERAKEAAKVAAREAAKEAANKKAQDMARKLLENGKLSHEEIAAITDLSVETVEELAGLQTV